MVGGAAALWGTWSLFFRPAERAQPVSPALEAVVVFAAVLAIVGPTTLRERAPAPRPRAAWLGLAALGVGDALNNLLFFAAMQRAPLAVAVLSHYLAPVLVAAAAPLALGERTRRATWAALALALAGLVLLLEPWRVRAAGAGGGARADVLAGAALGAGSAVFYAGNVLVIKRVQRWFTPRQLLAWHLVPAIPLVALFVPAGGFALGRESLAWLCAGAALPGALAGVMFLRGIAAVPASHGAVLTLLEPAVAVAVGAVAWREVPGPLAAVGALLVLAGAALVVRAAPPAG